MEKPDEGTVTVDRRRGSSLPPGAEPIPTITSAEFARYMTPANLGAPVVERKPEQETRVGRARRFFAKLFGIGSH